MCSSTSSAVGPVKSALHGPGEHVVDAGLDRPAFIAAVLNVLDEERIEIDGRDVADLLPHDPRAEGVRAADLQHRPSR